MAISAYEVSNTVHSASSNTGDFVTDECRGFLYILKVTAVTGTLPTLDIQWKYRDVLSNYFDIPGAALTQSSGIVEKSLLVYPGAKPIKNRRVNWPMTQAIQRFLTIGGTGGPSFTVQETIYLLP